MASYWQKKIFIIALILAIAIPISTARRRRSKDADKYLRDLCSKTDDSKKCWNILEPKSHQFADPDERDVANVVIELAIAKSKEIRDKLGQRSFSDSDNGKLKQKYRSCSKNYNEIDRNLELAQRSLDSDDYRNISDQIDDAGEELKRCRLDFVADPLDPSYIGDPNTEFGLYLDMVRVSVGRLGDSDA